MNKLFALVVFGCMATVSAFAAPSKVVADCTNGKDMRVKIVQITANEYRADITSPYSVPKTMHIGEVKLLPKEPRRMGAPTVYQAPGFEITIQYDALKAPATLTVADLETYNDRSLRCR
jgi:hypothetical protein